MGLSKRYHDHGYPEKQDANLSEFLALVGKIDVRMGLIFRLRRMFNVQILDRPDISYHQTYYGIVIRILAGLLLGNLC
jgi:hypothetical protein